MIIKNGKRLDGFCVDSLPIGTLQPYLGLKAPNGYLICDGSLISKTVYPDLYAICGNLFGIETDTHFYLPDLRGKTIAGYNADDATLNTIGKLLGAISHTHTSAAHTHTVAGHIHSTGNHTLTVAEMPSHTHNKETVTEVTSGAYAGRYMSGKTSADPNLVNNPVEYTGGNGAHNHGNTGSTSLTTDSTTPGATGSASNYQPTMVANWIVKAKMIVPVTAIVENNLESASEINALSAAQGKLLNESKLSLVGGTMQGPITFPENLYWAEGKYGIDMDNSDIVGVNSIFMNDQAGADEGLHFMRSNGNWDTLRAIDGGLYLNVNRSLDTGDAGTLVQIATKPDIEGTVVFNGQGSANWLAQDTVYSFDLTPYKYLLVHFTSNGVGNPTDRQSGNAVNQVVHIDLTTPSEFPICNVNGVYYRYGGTETHLDMQFLFGSNDDPGLFFSGLFVSEDKKKVYVGNAGYVVLGTAEPTVQWGSLYNGVSRIVGFK